VHPRGNPKKFALQGEIQTNFFARGKTKNTHFAWGKGLFNLKNVL
jgi:hypothetical protein